MDLVEVCFVAEDLCTRSESCRGVVQATTKMTTGTSISRPSPMLSTSLRPLMCPFAFNQSSLDEVESSLDRCLSQVVQVVSFPDRRASSRITTTRASSVPIYATPESPAQSIIHAPHKIAARNAAKVSCDRGHDAAHTKGCSSGGGWFELCLASRDRRTGYQFFPRFCSKNSTCFLTTGSYFNMLRGREVRGRTMVR
jgi:hypothetical protein